MVAKAPKIQAILLTGLVFTMLGMAFAAVPLYRMFCQKTGFGGTPKIVLIPTIDRITDRQVTVQFSADVQRNLPVHFKPLQFRTSVKAGEIGLAFYEVENTSDDPIVAMATYNVTPDKTAVYFNKVACFCFERQVLPPHKKLTMAVQFFIDPDFADDPNMKDIQLITLSYTFFRLKE